MNNHIKILLFILLLVVLFSISFTPVRVSGDEWWHLKTGKYIVEHNYRVPKYDVFAFTSANYEWDNHEWLTQVIFYKIYQIFEDRTLGGIRAVILFKTIVLMLTFSIVAYLINLRTYNCLSAIFFAILALLVSKKTIYVRPPLISYLFLALFLTLLYKYKLGKLKWGYLLSLPLLMILWANMHGGFILGLLVIGFFFTGDIVESLLPKIALNLQTNPPLNNYKKSISLYFSLMLLCLLASLCTPYGYKLYLLTSRVMNDEKLVNMISELAPPNFRYVQHYEFLITFILFGGLLSSIWQSPVEQKKLYFVDFLLLAFFLNQSLHHVRHLPLFGIAASPIAGVIATNLIEKAKNSLPQQKAVHIEPLFILVILVFSIYTVFTPLKGEPDSFYRRNRQIINGIDYIREDYPIAVADYIIEHNLKGNMFNEANDAGYLIWRLSPEHIKVFTDSRFDIFGGKFAFDETAISDAYESRNPDYNWKSLLDKYKIDFIVISRWKRLASLLPNDPDWKLAYSWINPKSSELSDGYDIYVRNKKQKEK